MQAKEGQDDDPLQDWPGGGSYQRNPRHIHPQRDGDIISLRRMAISCGFRDLTEEKFCAILDVKKGKG